MFSNISEAWSRDPVMEISSKISQGEFEHNRPQNNIFKIDSNKDIDTNSINLSANDISSDYLSYAPVKHSKNKSRYPIDKYSDLDSISELLPSDTLLTSRCNHCAKHLAKCNQCTRQIKKIINDRVNARLDQFILESRLKEIGKQQTVEQFHTPANNQWNQPLMIAIGILIIVLLLFLIMKSNK
jgi:hypothetical protein